jgi:hypothetical protein
LAATQRPKRVRRAATADLNPTVVEKDARDIAIGIARAGAKSPVLTIEIFTGLPMIEEFQYLALF